jgi:hypothetical protein
MIEKALRYLVGLKENKTYEIDGKTYSDNSLHLVESERFYRKNLEFGSLDAIVKMLKNELHDYTDGTEPVFIRVVDHKNVEVFTRPDDRERRLFPYSAKCTDADFREGWRDQQAAIIELRSRFLPTNDSAYLLDLISRINNEEGVQSADNGVSQVVTAKKGASLMITEQVRPRLSLTPFRTFREVPQPESEFILRLDENGRVGLFEADGGIWKIEAKANIADYLSDALNLEVKSGVVVVMI